MNSRTTSVAMTAAIEQDLLNLLVRDDGQEDLCLATYRPSTGETRSSALIRSVIPPENGDRFVHGNATVTADYILRVAEIAQNDECGLVLLHSHPGADRWQFMSGPDRDTESSYAYLVREITGQPLVGMTLSTANNTWSARHWDVKSVNQVDCNHCANVRVIGDKLAVSWNHTLRPPPPTNGKQIRSVSAWGEQCQSDLARRRILVVGAGSVGLDVIVRLAASGVCHLTIMDFDLVQIHNLDRLIGATPRDARLKRPKAHVAQREAARAATAGNCHIDISDRSICEPDGLNLALDHDVIFSCVDSPWARAVLNAMAYTDLIPVIDGGIRIDTFPDNSMRNAIWRSHVVRPQRPCMSCSRQLDLGEVQLDKQGLLGNPDYIAGSGRANLPSNPNVAPLSVNVAGSLLAQYVSFSVSPAGLGDPGPLRYSLNSHFLEHLGESTRPHCPAEQEEGAGDRRTDLTGCHAEAVRLRDIALATGIRTRLLRWADDAIQATTRQLDRLTG